MSETGPSVAETRSAPEQGELLFRQGRTGLEGRLLLGAQDARFLDATTPITETITDEMVGNLESRDYGAFSQASITERRATATQSTSEWSASVGRILGAEKHNAKRQTLQRLQGSTGINFESFNASQANHIYAKYFTTEGSDEDTSNWKGFVQDVLSSYRGEGGLDTQGLERDLPTIQWFAQIFGAKSAEAIAHTINAEAQLQQDRDSFITNLNRAIPTGEANEEGIVDTQSELDNLDEADKTVLRFVQSGGTDIEHVETSEEVVESPDEPTEPAEPVEPTAEPDEEDSSEETPSDDANTADEGPEQDTPGEDETSEATTDQPVEPDTTDEEAVDNEETPPVEPPTQAPEGELEEPEKTDEERAYEARALERHRIFRENPLQRKAISPLQFMSLVKVESSSNHPYYIGDVAEGTTFEPSKDARQALPLYSHIDWNIDTGQMTGYDENDDTRIDLDTVLAGAEDGPIERFLEARAYSNHRSDLLPLAAIGADTPEQQAHIFRLLGKGVLDIYTDHGHDNPSHLPAFLTSQDSTSQDVIRKLDRDAISDRIYHDNTRYKNFAPGKQEQMIFSALEKGTYGNQMFAYRRAGGGGISYDRQATKAMWETRVEELKSLLESDKVFEDGSLEEHHYMWLDFLSRGVKLPVLIDDLPSSASSTETTSEPAADKRNGADEPEGVDDLVDAVWKEHEARQETETGPDEIQATSPKWAQGGERKRNLRGAFKRLLLPMKIEKIYDQASPEHAVSPEELQQSSQEENAIRIVGPEHEGSTVKLASRRTFYQTYKGPDGTYIRSIWEPKRVITSDERGKENEQENRRRNTRIFPGLRMVTLNEREEMIPGDPVDSNKGLRIPEQRPDRKVYFMFDTKSRKGNEFFKLNTDTSKFEIVSDKEHAMLTRGLGEFNREWDKYNPVAQRQTRQERKATTDTPVEEATDSNPAGEQEELADVMATLSERTAEEKPAENEPEEPEEPEPKTQVELVIPEQLKTLVIDDDNNKTELIPEANIINGLSEEDLAQNRGRDGVVMLPRDGKGPRLLKMDFQDKDGAIHQADVGLQIYNFSNGDDPTIFIRGVFNNAPEVKLLQPTNGDDVSQLRLSDFTLNTLLGAKITSPYILSIGGDFYQLDIDSQILSPIEKDKLPGEIV